jgi:endogenous inhibitor of DNA gyrase (YacG/DUF329 family)
MITVKQKRQIDDLRNKKIGYSAISKILDIPMNTVKSYCYRNSLGKTFEEDLPAGYGDDECKNCGKPLKFIVGKRKKIYCCDKCRNDWWKNHPQLIQKKAVYNFVCPKCGKKFDSYGNKNRVYCSRECAASARRNSK